MAWCTRQQVKSGRMCTVAIAEISLNVNHNRRQRPETGLQMYLHNGLRVAGLNETSSGQTHNVILLVSFSRTLFQESVVLLIT